jgi:hypothetical protein
MGTSIFEKLRMNDRSKLLAASAPAAQPQGSVFATSTCRVQAYPVFESQEQLRDFLSRAAWHFGHLHEIELFVPLAAGVDVPDRITIPEGFAPEVQRHLDEYLPRIRFQYDRNAEAARTLLDSADCVLKWTEKRPEVDAAIAAARKLTYRVDPRNVRQEGSFFIQCAFDLYAPKQAAIEESRLKLKELTGRLHGKRCAWIMATGPSVEHYRECDFADSVVVACNSVVLNDDLMRHCKPSILVFADPIFHFGVSEYAGRFREIVAQRLASTDLTIIVPLKYYPLLRSKFPEHAERIIGVPFEGTVDFNLDLNKKFAVKTTANILTLLLIPIAATFAKEVRLIGCDGRPLEQDDYFWGHGKSVQINDKMENIKRVHPGFFDIDYNEYYFEHCHTLANALRQGEAEGWQFAHHGHSHIPALRDRSIPCSGKPSGIEQRGPHSTGPELCVVLEPDGIGMSGHYVRWHRQLISELQGGQYRRVVVLCNKKQDPSLYPCHAAPVLSSFSWGISRAEPCYRSDFAESQGIVRFCAEVSAGIRAALGQQKGAVSIFIYYGSVQIVKALQGVRKQLKAEGIELRVSVCLFHESVLPDPRHAAPRFPPGAREILMEAVAQADHYRVFSVTHRLSEHIRERFGVWTEVLGNPTPDRSDAQGLSAEPLKSPSQPESREHVILFPCNPRDEKGGPITECFARWLAKQGVPPGQRYLIRGAQPADLSSVPGVTFLGPEVTDDQYWENLTRADVVVIPYLAPAFTYRTSGILVDALFAGKPCVVFESTWLADTVKRHHAGIILKYRSELTIATAITTVLRHKERLATLTREGYRAYSATNSWALLASSISI